MTLKSEKQTPIFKWARRVIATRLFRVGVATVGVIAITGVLLWVKYGQALYAEAETVYQAGNCQAALPLYARLTRYPAFTGDFVNRATVEQNVCLAYRQTAQIAVTDEHAKSIAAYEGFLSEYANTPLATVVEARIKERYFAWSLSLREKGDFEQAVSRLEQLAATHPGFTPEVAPQILETYLAWGETLHQVGDFAAAVTEYETLAADYPAFAQQAREKILETDLAWGETLRADHNFAEAIAIFNELAARYPLFRQQANDEVLVTYLTWGSVLLREQNFKAAIDVYDALAREDTSFVEQANEELLNTYLQWGQGLYAQEKFGKAIEVYNIMVARGGQFVEPALVSRNRAYLAQGMMLANNGAYAEAEQILLALLQVEQKRLTPLSSPANEWILPQPYPYAVVKASQPATFRNLLHLGPGNEYEVLDYTQGIPANQLFAVVGSTPDAAWYAINMGQRGLASANLTAVRDVVWHEDDAPTIAWLPADEVRLELVGANGIPPSGVLVRALAAESEIAAQALAGLEGIYTDWAEAARGAGDFDLATTVYVALGELRLSQTERTHVRQWVAETHLTAAEVLVERGEYEASITHTLNVEDFDLTGEFFLSARTLRISNLLNLGHQAADSRLWQSAAEYYRDTLNLEEETFTAAWATVSENGAFLFASPDSGSERLQPVEAGRQLPVLAGQNQGEQDWILVLVPTIPTAQAWVPANQITLTTRLTDLPVYNLTDLPPLQSYTALVNLAQTHQVWGQAYYAEENYEKALGQFQTILDDPALSTVITGTAELAAQAWTDWGHQLVAEDQYAEAIIRFASALAIAPQAGSAAEANTALAELASELEQAVVAGAGCQVVPALDALAETDRAWQANQWLPQALYQCGLAWQQEENSSKAKEAYQRVLDEFANSSYAARAHRGIQEIEWKTLVESVGISVAAGRICRETSNGVQAPFTTIDEPYIVYVNGFNISSLLPTSWRGSVEEINVIVCIEDIEERLAERCPYYLPNSSTPDAHIERYSYFLPGRIVNPITRLTVTQGNIYGIPPVACPDQVFLTVGEVRHYYGEQPDADDVLAWLKQYVPEN